MATLKFRKKANIHEPLSVAVDGKPADPALAGVTIEVRPDRRAVTERAWSKAQQKDSAQVNTLRFLNRRVEDAICGWSLRVSHLGALGIAPEDYAVDVDPDDGDPLVEFSADSLGWMLTNSKRFDDLASTAVRRAYGEQDAEADAEAEKEAARKND